jgi:phage terminase large subunit-like protein
VPVMTECACAPRYATPRTSDRGTLGGAAAKIARVLGSPLMPWQRQVLDVALETDSAGRLIYGDVVLTVPRQQGKSLLVLVLMISRALLESRQSIVYCAQTGLDARRKWAEDWLPLIEASPLGSQVSAYHAPGRESLRFPNGSVQRLVASTAKSGHGQIVDLAAIDEAFSFQDARLEQALRPAMMTRENPQLWVVSTAGTPSLSPYLLERVERGRLAAEAGLTEGLAFFEWSAPDDADPGDPATWHACMPALGHTVDELTVKAAFVSMPRHEFMRAFLNRWTTQTGDPAIALEEWAALTDVSAPRPAEMILAADVSPGSKSAAIAAAGERDGVLYVSVLEHGPGTDWLLPRLEALATELGVAEVIADAKAAAPLLTGFRGAKLTETSATEMAEGCTFLVDLVSNGKLRHRGERELTIALDGAAGRFVGLEQTR